MNRRDDDARNRLIYALDYPDLDAAARGVDAVSGCVGCVKVGLELYVRHGPEAVALGRRAAADVFLDLKLHDIPETVGRAVANTRSLGVRFLTVHASGGSAMLRAAVDSAAGSPTIVAVTVLTSLDRADVAAIGFEPEPSDLAVRLAELAFAAGVRALVCSPLEVARIRSALGAEALLITPGVRPSGGSAQDQKRVATPGEALAAGADMLVVGRPIRDAADPRVAARSVVTSIAAALAER